MQKKHFQIAGIIGVVLLGGVFVAHQAEAISFRGFVDLLVERGIISGDKANQARMMADGADAAENKLTPNADKIDIEVSQFIQFAEREYPEGEKIEGLILTAKNTSGETITLGARRQCAVSYKIWDGDDMLYNSAEHDPCTTGENVFYALPAGQPRVFRVVHESSDYHLKPGKYTFEIEYPGYGRGQKSVRVLGDE